MAVAYAASPAHAYMEYAVRNNIIRCTACHLSPVGGGPRNVDGKLYGAHGWKLNPVLAQDYVSADLRVLYFYPERPTATKSGMGVMSGSVSGHVALDPDKRVQVTIEHNLTGFGAAPYRDTYALFALSPLDNQPHFFDSLMVGRFRLPFGIMTDEHQTFTRVQSATEWFTMQEGLLLSGTPTDKVHYDLAALNGETATGSSLSTGQATKWGSEFNIRYMPGPILLGSSASFFQHEPQRESRQAASVYSVVSVARWTQDRLPVTLHLEFEQARNWDDHLAQGFANDPAYPNGAKQATSSGWLAWVNYSLGRQWVFTYKYDLLTPDRDFPADIYERHGLGTRWYFAPGAQLWVRTEFARATHPSERGSTSWAGQNATYGVLEMEF